MRKNQKNKILVSQPDLSNPLIFSGFCFHEGGSGSKTGHENINVFSLYDAIMELCKENS